MPVQSARNKNCNTFRTHHYAKFKMIEEKCPKLKAYAEKRAGKENRDKFISGAEKMINDEGKALLTQCVDAVVEDQLMGTLVHELGHNLGLRHNFAGSTDKENFWNDQWINTNMPGVLDKNLGASIMDYDSPAAEALRLPGKYDVAALLFGYGGKIIKANGFKGNVIEKDQTITLNPKRSIEGNLTDAKLTLKDTHRFKYCTDEDVMAESDPMCAQHDYGTTPLESTLHRMAQIEIDMAEHSFRYDKPQSVVRDQGFWILYKKHRFQPLRRMYEEWRWQMESRVRIPWSIYKKIDDPNKHIREYLNQVRAIRKSLGDNNDGYYVSSNIIFEFLLNMVMLPNKYCVGIKNKQLKLIELDFARNDRFQKYRRMGQSVSIESCEAAALQEVFKNEFDDGKYLGEIGFEINDVAFVENQVDRDRRPLFDVESFRNFREAALEYLVRWKDGDATVQSDIRGVRRFFPRFIDEPHFRHRVFQAFLDRNYFGLIVAPLGIDAKVDDARTALADINKMTFLPYLPDDMSDRYVTSVPKFMIEQQIISYFANTFKDRLKISQGPTGWERDDADGARMFGVEISDQPTSACFSGAKTPRAELSIEEIANNQKKSAPANSTPVSQPAPVPQPAPATPEAAATAPATPDSITAAPATAAAGSATPVQPVTPTPGQLVLSKRYLCPDDVRYSYMSKMTIEKYNLARDRYIGYSKLPLHKDDVDGHMMGHELQMGLEMMKRYMEPPVNQ